jgi:hypothetical protein
MPGAFCSTLLPAVGNCTSFLIFRVRSEAEHEENQETSAVSNQGQKSATKNVLGICNLTSLSFFYCNFYAPYFREFLNSAKTRFGVSFNSESLQTRRFQLARAQWCKS